MATTAMAKSIGRRHVADVPYDLAAARPIWRRAVPIIAISVVPILSIVLLGTTPVILAI